MSREARPMGNTAYFAFNRPSRAVFPLTRRVFVCYNVRRKVFEAMVIP
jgi:hypothetical protein